MFVVILRDVSDSHAACIQLKTSGISLEICGGFFGAILKSKQQLWLEEGDAGFQVSLCPQYQRQNGSAGWGVRSADAPAPR